MYYLHRYKTGKCRSRGNLLGLRSRLVGTQWELGAGSGGPRMHLSASASWLLSPASPPPVSRSSVQPALTVTAEIQDTGT